MEINSEPGKKDQKNKIREQVASLLAEINKLPDSDKDRLHLETALTAFMSGTETLEKNPVRPTLDEDKKIIKIATPLVPGSASFFVLPPSTPDKKIAVDAVLKESSSLVKPQFDSIPDNMLLNIASYLDKRDIFLYLALTNRRSSKLPKLIPVWKAIYFSCDLKARNQLLQDAINQKFFSLFHDPKIQDTLGFKDIAALRVGETQSLLLYTIQQSHYSLRHTYLNRASHRIQAVEKQIQSKLLELKDRGFDFPEQRLQNYEILDEKQTKQIEQDFKKLLNVFKQIVERDLKSQIAMLVEGAQNYVETYFNVLFSDETDWQKLIEKAGGFGQLMLTRMPKYSINFDEHNLIVEKAGDYMTNILSLVISLGNLSVLVANGEKIKGFISTATELGLEEVEAGEKYFHPGKLMAQAAEAGNIAEMQFLYELGLVEKNLSYHKVSIHQALEYSNYEAVKLVIAHGGKERLAAISFGRTPLQAACDAQNILGILILVAAGIDLDSVCSLGRTMLEKVAHDVGFHLKKISSDPSIDLESRMQIALSNSVLLKTLYLQKLPAQLEVIRVLLICGADKSKVTNKTALQTIDAIYKRNESLGASFLSKAESTQVEDKKKSALRVEYQERKTLARNSPLK